jgi:hypothetical protein
MTKWVQVWGRECPDDELEMLYRFPGNQWTEEFGADLLGDLAKRGVTDVEVRLVETDDAREKP